MAAIPYEVARAFMRKEAARAGAFVSMGDAIYSYKLKLAHWDTVSGRVVIDVDLSAKQPSVTTSRHVSALRAVV